MQKPSVVSQITRPDRQLFRGAGLLESREGWEVCGEATNGRSAVEECRRLKPDIVVMDLSLPDLNGLDATRHDEKCLGHQK